MQENNKNRPIFIVGCERSGTTMLRLILCSHENIAIPPQTKYIKKLYKRRLIFGDLSKPNNRTKLINWFSAHHDKKTKIVDLGIDKKAVHSLLKNAGNTLGAFIAIPLKLYSQKLGKERWGDKHPYYIKYLPQLFKIFPDAQVIHIIRDGGDAVASLKRMPWWKKSSMQAMLNWQEAVKKGAAAKQKYSTDQFMEIRYEDIIGDPKKSIKLVCDFLKEEYSDNLLEFHKIAGNSVPSYKMDWHANTMKKINSQSIGRWVNDLTDWEIALINKKLKKELSTHNYERNQHQTDIPLKIRFKFIIAKIRYRYLQYSSLIIDKIISIFYQWDMDYRK